MFFQQSSCKLLFISVFTLKLILIMCTFDFKKIIDIVCLAYVTWKSKHKLWNASAFVVLNMFVNVNLSKFVFIHSDHVCL